ncbi:hypothetical protein Tco_1296073, partial [Tanacetum coccineum]
CKKIVECVACLLCRWNKSRGTVEESHGIALIGGETTWHKHYGGESSNRVASDVAEEEVVDPRKVEMVMGPGGVEMAMNVNEIEDHGRSSGQDHLDYEGECWLTAFGVVLAAFVQVELAVHSISYPRLDC